MPRPPFAPPQFPKVPLHARDQPVVNRHKLLMYGLNSRPAEQRVREFFSGNKTPAPTGGADDQFGHVVVGFLEQDVGHINRALDIAGYRQGASADPFHYKARGAGRLPQP
jgi:hypothetical protein